ncbi:hypothetical protein Rahaq2_4923 (plasmid) [Rahnella aquatilis CIP 78.65 = ATCC 33071]|uniref:Uncharacterized protein n=1 Tax=Rahnella aquatilis (strain ATCC 33071 / DSM 4594 / JCM 1683 / NBRC 105701 / NCIMB 13365 / CIP 78.65) TaxID=745277 RepID=H2J243_RAHAC|nr:hypothetical protein Rahaq2_4923 [Rahnella aquatilis CIP 78.65 = ATCC 33071]
MINSGDVWSSREKKHSLIIEIKVNRSGNGETFPPATQCQVRQDKGQILSECGVYYRI